MHRTLERFWTTGDVKRKDFPAERGDCKLTTTAHLFLIHQLIDNPGINLKELKDSLLVELGINVTESRICKFLKKKGFSRQRMRTYAMERDTELRKQFVVDVSVFKEDMLVFLDETGCDCRDLYRRKGYSIRGMPMTCQRLFAREEHISVIAYMSTIGILDCSILRGGVDGDAFYRSLQQSLLIYFYIMAVIYHLL